ncbi:MAG: hypothetical protein ACJARX_001118 [Psychroserpens sp.]|jgi:hypothetical protein|uniref:hypothetical protein n=1 Tax=Psychroserpens sp. TaxID=2020870 RepID=UPI0039E2776F
MRLRNLKSIFLFFCISHLNIYAHDSIDISIKDTISFSEENSQKVIEFGQLIDASIHNSDADTFISKLNKNKFFDRVLFDYPAIDREDDFIKGYLKGMNNALKSFPNEIIADVQNGAYYDFINYRYDIEAQTYYALFRFYSPNSGMNYHDYRITKVNDELQFSDMYIYLTGEHFANTIGRLMKYTIPKELIKDNQETSNNTESKILFKAILYNKEGDYEKAYKLINSIKSDLSKEKFLLIFKTLIAAQVDDNEYLKSLEDLISTFPNDQTIALNRIDYHLYKEDYIEAIQVINQLQNETEDDFLNFLKAGIAFEDKNYDLALNLYQYTTDNYPDFFEGQAGYLSTLVVMENYTECTTYLDSLISEGYDKEGLVVYIEEDDEFGNNILRGYSISQEFKNWKKL